MIDAGCTYRIKEDIGFILETEQINISDLSSKTGISRTTLEQIKRTGTTTDQVCEKFYSFIYEKGYRINSVKEELSKEKYDHVLYHGSKTGLTRITTDGSRDNCDFGKGFYLGETYEQALAFVCEFDKSSVYSFRYSPSELKIKELSCNLDWMLSICHYRGTLGKFSRNGMVTKIINDIESADLVIAPIADNKMFYIMALFTEGEINSEVALHSLSASKLGMQYIFRTNKALNSLSPIEKHYLCNPEREDCRKRLIERSYEIDTKLKLAKREFKNGFFIEELL